MFHQLTVFVCTSALLMACANTDVEEMPAGETATTAVALQPLRAEASSSQSSALRASLKRASSRLSDLQADSFGDHARNGLLDDDPDDSGWDWVVAPSSTTHSVNPSPDNLYGTIGFSPWVTARIGAANWRTQASLFDVLLGMARDPAIDSPTDIVFLAMSSELFRGRYFSTLARERYDTRVATAGDAEALGTNIRDARHAAGFDALIAYDLGWLALSAMALDELFPRAGYQEDVETYVRLVVDDLTSSAPFFDYLDAREVAYVYGLAWSTLVASWDTNSRALYVDLRTRLVELQLPDGAWPYNEDYPEAHLQATAHALMAYSLLESRAPGPRAEPHLATAWLMAQQAENGGWPYTATEEYPAVNAEIALAMYLAEVKHADLRPERPRWSKAWRTPVRSSPLSPPLAVPEGAP